MSQNFSAAPAGAIPPLEAGCETFETAVVVTVSGGLDVISALELEALIMTAMDDAGPYRDVVVDLSGASYMDSSALNLVQRCHDRGTREGTALRVVASSCATLRPIRLAGLDGTLLLYLATADAITARRR